jgi:hypothetical protein
MCGSTEAGLAGPRRTRLLRRKPSGSSDTLVKASERCSARIHPMSGRSGGGFVSAGASIAYWWVTPDPP